VKKEIRILYVEDVPAEVVMVNHELRMGGLAFRTKRVETRDAFIHELELDTPDLILCDHGLPSFDGFTALAIARDKCPQIPFIFVTGSLGEQVAIETFESGATDYVLKSRLAKLVPAVQRALREAQERTALREKDQALRESEERFRMLVEGVKDYAIFMLDKEGRLVSWNSGAEWLHGYSAEEVLGQPFSLFYTRADVERGRPLMALRVASAEGRFEEEGLRVSKGGKEFWANVVISVLRDARGRLRGYAQVTRNITERIRAQEALQKSDSLKTTILETVLDGILSIDEAGNIREWNSAAQRIFGYARADVLGRPMDELIIPAALREAYHGGVANYLMTGVGSLLNRPIELTLRRADGSEFRAELAITRLRTEEPSGCTALVRDVTERNQAKAALQESEERFRLLVEGVKDYAIYMLDPEGRVATWNAGAERLEGYRAEEVLGQHLSTFFTPEDVEHDVAREALRRAEEQGQVTNEGWRVRKDGSRFWTVGILTALRDESGRLRGFAKLAHDMTARKETEEEIQRLNEDLERRVVARTAQLEAANQELEAFSYSVSHDLRAPLRHIAGYAEILRADCASSLNEQGKSHLNTINEAARQMGTLIDALLEFSRMGRAGMIRQPVSVAALVEDARGQLHREMQGRDIDWQLGDLPAVRGDPIMLRQVIINLLSNALKYTRGRPHARIEVGATRGEEETVFFVRDNGVGFDMRYAEKLFGVFQRLHSPSEFEGTGIGLANVRRIIHRHGGRAWAEGAVDRGATFYIAFPHTTHQPREHNDHQEMDSAG
jgi:PAS domain S-box-containing protein